MCFFSLLVASFPGLLKEESLLNVPKPLPKQLWETKEVGEQSSAAVFTLAGRPPAEAETRTREKGREDLAGHRDREDSRGWMLFQAKS